MGVVPFQAGTRVPPDMGSALFVVTRLDVLASNPRLSARLQPSNMEDGVSERTQDPIGLHLPVGVGNGLLIVSPFWLLVLWLLLH